MLPLYGRVGNSVGNSGPFTTLGDLWLENVKSFFNFNSAQLALVLEDYAPALRVRGFVSTKKGARSIGEETKEGENNNNNL